VRTTYNASHRQGHTWNIGVDSRYSCRKVPDILAGFPEGAAGRFLCKWSGGGRPATWGTLSPNPWGLPPWCQSGVGARQGKGWAEFRRALTVLAPGLVLGSHPCVALSRSQIAGDRGRDSRNRQAAVTPGRRASNRALGRRFGVTERAIRYQLKRQGRRQCWSMRAGSSKSKTASPGVQGNWDLRGHNPAQEWSRGWWRADGEPGHLTARYVTYSHD
jgi:hypothetical protein